MYGVVLDGDSVDADATADVRSGLRARRLHLHRVPAAADDAFEAVGRGRKRVARLNPDDAATLGLGDDDMLELLSDRGGAPLRAWLRVDAATTRGTVPLDESGARILRASDDARLQVRPLYRAALA